MRLLEKLSANIFRIITGKQPVIFRQFSPEVVLKRSLEILDENAANGFKTYITGSIHHSGGFVDKAGKPDLYYTLFGVFLAEAFELRDVLKATAEYVEHEIRNTEPVGVNLHCASILISKYSFDKKLKRNLQKKIRTNLDHGLIKQPVYGMFLTLLACYYSGDIMGLLKVKKHLHNLSGNEILPSTVIAAMTVLQHIFGQPTADLINKLHDFYDSRGGFRAVKTAPVPDLLSTAVTLYAYYFTQQDLRTIKPDCLSFIDSLHHEGGFGANILDPEPDIEYTFYGILGLGSLA